MSRSPSLSSSTKKKLEQRKRSYLKEPYLRKSKNKSDQRKSDLERSRNKHYIYSTTSKVKYTICEIIP